MSIVHNLYMKLKILKFFALMFGMQFVMCPFGQDTKPNTLVCTLPEALELANYTYENKQSVYKSVLDHFTTNGQDFLNMQLLADKSSAELQLKQIGELPPDIMLKIQSFLITSESFQLPLRVYFALFPKCDFIQGKDGTFYLPAVMSDGKVQMVDSGMQFECNASPDKTKVWPNSEPEAGNQKIIGSIYSSDKCLLAEIEITIDKNRLIQGLATLIWKRDCCTPELIAHFNRHGNSHYIHSGRFEIYSNLFRVKKFGDKSMIDPLDTLLVSEPGCQYEFPMTQILVHILLRFIDTCQSALPNTVGRSFRVMDIQAFSDVSRLIAARLAQLDFYIPVIAFFETGVISNSADQS